MTLGISRIFRYTDASAPVINTAAAGSINSMLKAVLVNGYGAKSSLGWELVYDASNVLVVRMPAGTRRFVRFDNSAVNTLVISSYKTMSDINNGTERIPPPAVNMSSSIFSMNAGVTPWYIIGDEAGFWMIARPWYSSYPDPETSTYGNYWHPSYIGDYNPWDIRNKWNFCLFYPSAYNYPFVPGGASAGTLYYIERASSFKIGAVPANLLGFSTTYFGVNQYCVNVDEYAHTQRIGGVFYGVPVRVVDFGYTKSGKYVVVGSLPGVLDPICGIQSATGAFAGGVSTKPFETTDSEGNLSISAVLCNSSSNAPSTTGRLIFNVGKGFRNAQ